MHEPAATMPREITRRNALVAGAAVFGVGFGNSAARAADKPRVDPFHDPAYSRIHARADLIKLLRDDALHAQEKPRGVNGVHVTGLPRSVLELDEAVTRLLKASGIPGAAICIAKSDRLVCTRGYGRASLVGNVPVEPTMPATVMSISKPLTVTAALTLVRDGKLRLDDDNVKMTASETYKNWTVDAPAGKDSFTFAPPKDATKVEEFKESN